MSNKKATTPTKPASATQGNAENMLPRLDLPKRWELLRQRAEDAKVDLLEFVERVDSAAARVDKLLYRVRTGGGGLFEVFLGTSGSGKTTFLNTLSKFFDRVRVHSFPRDRALVELSKFIAETFVPSDDTERVILIERRDNPQSAELALVEGAFVELLEAFREGYGKVLVLWPITLEPAAKTIAAKAWEIGRDSLVDSETRGLFRFQGVPKERYYPLADATTRTLTGDGLEAFGIDQTAANELLPECETIAAFFGAVSQRADEQREATWSVLREKVRARLWVLLPGDDVTALKGTVSALVQGTRNRVDIDRIGEIIDRPDNKAIYVKDWRQRRGSLGHLLRTIDVRLLEVPPNVALAAIRSFGDAAAKRKLKQQSANLEQSKQAMRSSRLYKTILLEAGFTPGKFAGYREVKQETEDEFRRVQAQAAKNDKPLNKALGDLIASCLEEDAPALSVVSERKSIEGSTLQPDIRIDMGQAGVICLEPTWRTSGKGVEGEIAEAQNTLAEAHLQKYVLEKAWQYIKDLGL